MKKLIAIMICILLVSGAIVPTAVAAEEAPEAEQIIDVDTIDADTVPDSDNYQIVDDGETLLEVTHVQAPGLTAALNDTITNGYYTADFMLPESNYHVFLTGLTQNNIDMIRQKIISSYKDGADFKVENLDFIDAEKTWFDDGDENLCWAAAASNVLTYTGWAAQAGFNSTDDVFEAFISAFNDDAGNVEYATGWFIDGVSAPGGAQPAAGTGRYLPQYQYTDLVNTLKMVEGGIENIKTAYDRLKNGYGVTLSTDIYGRQGYEGGHSVTCWGFVTDIRYPDNSPQYYKSVFITDSDSDKYWIHEGMDRRDADNVMGMFTLMPELQQQIETYRFHITNQQTALITEVVTVAPFSEDIPHETSPDATMNSMTTPDIVIDPFILTDDANNDDGTKTVFAPGTKIYFHPYMVNIANMGFRGRLSLRIRVYNEQGTEVYSRNFSASSGSINPSSGLAFAKTAISADLPVGDYTITATFNVNHDVVEAYFFNNSKSINFKIRERYQIGDADGDGSITTVDTTMMQRVLAKFVMEDNTDLIKERSDVTGDGRLDLMDVTCVQRYLAHSDIPYAVDIPRFYE